MTWNMDHAAEKYANDKYLVTGSNLDIREDVSRDM